MNLVLFDDSDVVGHTSSTFDAGAEFTVTLRDRRRDHVREVHRAEPGRELAVGRLGGLIGRGVVLANDERELALRVRLTDAPPPKLPITLLLALPRPKTLRRVLQCVATMGVARLVLLNSWRVEKSFWKSPALAPDAIGAELRLGLEQGRDTILPIIETRRLLVPFARDELDAQTRGSRRLLADPGATTPCPHSVAGPITLALGPEGGFIQDELDLFARHGFEPVSLGPRPLRVEQAVPAIVARVS